MPTEYIHALILGIIQGLTEFLPISSSGHLVITEALLGFAEPDLLFGIAVHIGSLVAVFIVFRKDLTGFVITPVKAVQDRDAWSGPSRLFQTYPALRMLLLIVIASAPTGVIGLLFKDTFESLFSSLLAVGIALCVTGTLLFLTRNRADGKRGVLQFSYVAAFLVGVAQAMAITPGISRSGTTICIALFLGADREFAGRFSFLIAIPAILGALLVGLGDTGELSAGYIGVLLTGLATAALVGYIALRWLLAFVRSGKLYYFAPYCWTIGTLLIVYRLLK